MTDINELPSWEESISLISRSEKVEGGQDGPANRATKQLANRTLFLKQNQDNISDDLAGKVSAINDFAVGATLESPRDEILYGNYRLVWTGDFPKVVPAGSSPVNTGGIGAGAWANVGDAALRGEIMNPDGTGAKPITYRHSNVHDVLSRLATLADYGSTLPYRGYDSTLDPQIYAAQDALSDTKLLLNGGLSIATKFNGVCRGANTLCLRGGRSSPDAGSVYDFVPQVMNIRDSMAAYAFGSLDVVTLYSDITLGAHESFEDVSSATYTSNTVTFSSADSEAYEKVKVGAWLKTKHSTPCLGRVVSKSNGVITVDMWADSGTTTTTPTDGTGLYVNPHDKGWASNFVTIIPAGTKYKTGTTTEFSILNNGIANPTSLNCLDVVVLAGAYNATAGVYVHGSGGRSFAYGIISGGNRIGFESRSGERQPYAGFYEHSDAVAGIRQVTTNSFASQLITTSNNQTDVSQENIIRMVDPNGRVVKSPERILSIAESAQMPLLYPVGYVIAAGVTITMPPVANLPTSGYKYTFRLIKAGKYYFTAYNGEVAINGFTKPDFTTTEERKTVEIQWDGNQWQLFGPY